MSKIADDGRVNGKADWVMVIPVAVIGAVGAVVFGVVFMVKWAASMVLEGVKQSVRSRR